MGLNHPTDLEAWQAAIAAEEAQPAAQDDEKPAPVVLRQRLWPMIEMLRRAEGATLAEIVEATHWATHTTRGFLAGAIKKKLGLIIESTKDDARGRIYRLG